VETSGFSRCTRCSHFRQCFPALTVLNAAINSLVKLEATGDLAFRGDLMLDTTRCYTPRKEKASGRA